MAEGEQKDIRSRDSRDEITMADLVLMLVRWRFVLLGVLIVTLVSGFGWLLQQPDPGYQGTAAIEFVAVPQEMVSLTVADDVSERRSGIAEAVRESFRDTPNGYVVAIEVGSELGVRLIGPEKDKVKALLNSLVSGSELRLQVTGAEKENVKVLLDSLVSEGRRQIESEWLPFARTAVMEWNAYVKRLVDLREKFMASEEELSSVQELATLTAAEMGVRERLDAARSMANEARSLFVAHEDGRLEKSVLLDPPRVSSLSRTGLYSVVILVFSIALALLAAFFAEFISGVRQRLRQS